jgi:hypothetical protein
MRINSLFEHDASMKRQAEATENADTRNQSTMSTTIYEDSVADVLQVSPAKPAASNSNPNGNSNSSKPATQRHRASIACASCRDRRIRVSGLVLNN